MKVTNNAPFDVVAFGTHIQKGYGVDIRIPAGQTAEVNGPYLGEMGGGSCYVALAGGITCQDTPDDKKGLQVLQGTPLCLGAGDRGITIRHYRDMPEKHVAEWRRNNHDEPPPKPDRGNAHGAGELVSS